MAKKRGKILESIKNGLLSIEMNRRQKEQIRIKRTKNRRFWNVLFLYDRIYKMEGNLEYDIER